MSIAIPHPLGAAYPVHLPVFQGPLELLLHLIERQELDISEVSLVAVTDQYLQTLQSLEEIEPGALADFLVVASRLLFIKSRALLPQPPAADEEEEENPGDALVRQLLAYRQFKQVAAALREREEQGLRAYARTAPVPKAVLAGSAAASPPVLEPVGLEKLYAALRRVLERMPAESPAPRVHTYAITVAEKIADVRARMAACRQRSRQEGRRTGLAFHELLADSSWRMEVIVTFLAVLELIKRRELEARQTKTFGPIWLLPTDEELPSIAPPA